jgi:membrane-associated phospholipid phosphatase
LFVSFACLVGLERVAELAHYVSDVAAAALLSVVMFPLALRVNNAAWKDNDANALDTPTVDPP